MGGGHSHQHDAHTRALINDHDPIAVTELHHLLRIGVVAGTEGVGTKPAKQVEVLHQQWPVKTLPSDLGDRRLEGPSVISEGIGKVKLKNSSHRDPGASTHICILMLVDPMEIERFSVNEELALCDTHSTNTHRESVEVRHGPSCCLCSQPHL